MERKRVKAGELEIGKRYRVPNTRFNFTVTRKDGMGVWMLFNDGKKILYFTLDMIDVSEFPLSSLEKELF